MVTKLVANVILNFDSKFRHLRESNTVLFHTKFAHYMLKCDVRCRYKILCFDRPMKLVPITANVVSLILSCDKM